MRTKAMSLTLGLALGAFGCSGTIDSTQVGSEKQAANAEEPGPTGGKADSAQREDSLHYTGKLACDDKLREGLSMIPSSQPNPEYIASFYKKHVDCLWQNTRNAFQGHLTRPDGRRAAGLHDAYETHLQSLCVSVGLEAGARGNRADAELNSKRCASRIQRDHADLVDAHLGMTDPNWDAYAVHAPERRDEVAELMGNCWTPEARDGLAELENGDDSGLRAVQTLVACMDDELRDRREAVGFDKEALEGVLWYRNQYCDFFAGANRRPEGFSRTQNDGLCAYDYTYQLLELVDDLSDGFGPNYSDHYLGKLACDDQVVRDRQTLAPGHPAHNQMNCLRDNALEAMERFGSSESIAMANMHASYEERGQTFCSKAVRAGAEIDGVGYHRCKAAVQHNVADLLDAHVEMYDSSLNAHDLVSPDRRATADRLATQFEQCDLNAGLAALQSLEQGLAVDLDPFTRMFECLDRAVASYASSAFDDATARAVQGLLFERAAFCRGLSARSIRPDFRSKDVANALCVYDYTLQTVDLLNDLND